MNPKVKPTLQDCNNLYGYAMKQKLPHSGFRWLTEDELDILNIEDFNIDGDTGLILEVA